MTVGVLGTIQNHSAGRVSVRIRKKSEKKARRSIELFVIRNMKGTQCFPNLPVFCLKTFLRETFVADVAEAYGRVCR